MLKERHYEIVNTGTGHIHAQACTKCVQRYITVLPTQGSGIDHIIYSCLLASNDIDQIIPSAESGHC